MHRPARLVAHRRPRVGPAHLCATLAALLLLLSVSVLYTRLAASASRRGFLPATFSGVHPFPDSLADDDDDAAGGKLADPIDQWDEVEEDDGQIEAAAADNQSSELYWDHAAGVARRSFGKLEYDSGGSLVERGEMAFTSDDLPLDESVREKLGEIRSVEDALLLKGGHGGGSKLRDGWAPWFEQKGAYLRRDRMFRGNLESLNPMNNPLLQDPDLPGLTSLTRGDRIVQKAMLNEISKLPFGLDYDKNGRKTVRKLNSQVHDQPSLKKVIKLGNLRKKSKEPIFADGRRWGYYPGVNSKLSFSEFMRQFLGKGSCSISIFMVWNGPDWMYGVRHQRGLESVLRVHSDACVVVFSETIELNFFSDFVDDGYGFLNVFI